MEKKLRKKLWKWRGLLITVPLITGIIILLRSFGLLQFFELAAYDQFVRLNSQENKDYSLVIVAITEADIQNLKKPTPNDAELAQIITKIKNQKPLAIGLDIVRDLPVEPGYQDLVKVFKNTPHLLGIKQVVAWQNQSPIQGSPILEELGRITVPDLIFDPDGKIRRGFLYISSEEETLPSLGLGLAEIYLKKQGITPQPSAINPEDLQLGKAVFIRFKSNDGSYINSDDGGYQMLLNFYQKNPFKIISLTELLEDNIPPHLMQDKIVLIGYTAQSKKDFFLTPYSSLLIGNPELTSGVEIHAYIANQIIKAALGKQPLIKTWTETQEQLWILIWCLITTIISWKYRYKSKFNYDLTLYLLLIIISLFTISYLAFIQGWWIPLIPPLLAIIGSHSLITGYLTYQASDLRSIFGRYLTDEVVNNLLENPENLNLVGKRQKVTILISDLRGFTNISLWLSPEDTFSMLNLYLESMTEIIQQYQGTINDFIGDAILVFFGAPTQQEDDAQRAIACALAMQLEMVNVNQKLTDLGLPKIKMGIGINTGEVLVGNIGSKKQAKWTVIGNNINLASRIESYTVGGQVLISEATLQEAGIDLINVSNQQSVQPKGTHTFINIYEVVGIKGKYQVNLPPNNVNFLLLEQEILIKFSIIQGKNVTQEYFDGKIIKLSLDSAVIKTEASLDSLMNISISLLDEVYQSYQNEEFYGKIMQRLEPDLWLISFAILSPKISNLIQFLNQK